jgi:hypothetical protein
VFASSVDTVVLPAPGGPPIMMMRPLDSDDFDLRPRLAAGAIS